jgi:hypothetical protein
LESPFPHTIHSLSTESLLWPCISVKTHYILVVIVEDSSVNRLPSAATKFCGFPFQ